jgi:uncharacterized damage-inducible protein DinB
MSLAAFLTEQLNAEIESSRRVIERITDASMEWRPHDKSWTTKETATHVAVLVGWGGMILGRDEMDFASEEMQNWKPPKPDTVEEMLAVLEANAEQARTALAGMSDEDLQKPWTMRAGEQIFAQDSKAATFYKWVLSHQSHHRGQLTVYLRSNDIPLPGIFGPSADEQGMG